MATDYIYPTSAELSIIAQDKLPRLTAQRPIFDVFPISTPDQFLVMWEQQDNFAGLQAVRGIDGTPSRVSRIGAKRYQMEPGIYGEFVSIDEAEITTRRKYGTFGDAIDVTDAVMLAQDHLLQRRLDRVELIAWTLLTTGTFSVVSPNGAVTHTDTYSPQTFAAATTWATAATSTPLADLRAVKLQARGHSVSFGPDAKLYLNQKTVNNLLANTNATDLYGRRTAGLGTFNSISQVNELFMADNLPTIVEYDEGYFAKDGLLTIPVTTAGSGYTSVPTVVIPAPPSGGTQATAVAVLTSQTVTGITITNPGAGYQVAPTVTLTGGGGSGAVVGTVTVGNAFIPFIADGLGVLVGRRPGNVPVGNYQMVRNAQNPGAAPGAYMLVVDNAGLAVPRQIQVHDGHNGGPSLTFPSAVVTLTL